MVFIMLRTTALLITLALSPPILSQDAVSGRSHSRSLYFDWINSQYEGTTEDHTQVNLEFFRWLHDEYGMELDIYSLDVGNVDDGAYTAGAGRFIPAHYGDLNTPSFRHQFPRGFAPLAESAAAFGARLGIWLGPDGFGDSPSEEEARTQLLIELVRDHGVGLFKFDSVAGNLRSEKQQAFASALARCREILPELIVLNERLELGLAAGSVTTNLWAGQETYIDVFNWNEVTAPHNRAGALARELPPGMDRTWEDHGVCLSSCLDGWDDDIVLQAFNRASILAPEIYGSPWLLRDRELVRMARLFNLHRRYRDELVDGVRLPEERYGPSAVARGDGTRRFITLRNLSWRPVSVSVLLDESLGLEDNGALTLLRLHPREKVIGRFAFGDEVDVEVEPFRSCLLVATSKPLGEVTLHGAEYEVLRDVSDRPVEMEVLGLPGTQATVRLDGGTRRFSRASLDGVPLPELLEGRAVEVDFPGKLLREPWRRTVGPLEPCPVPEDAEALFESTCFAADSNALEVRSLERSGPSAVPEVISARRAFFQQPMFVNRGIDDAQLFDGDLATFFTARETGGVLRLDLGALSSLERLLLHTMDREAHALVPEATRFAESARLEVSADLSSWQEVPFATGGDGTIAVATMPAEAIRYVRVHGAPRRLAEIEGVRGSEALDRSGWRASNLLPHWRPAVSCWSRTVKVEGVVPGAKLAVAVEGHHGSNGAWVAARIDGHPVGFPDRAPSYPSNTWEYKNVDPAGNTTHYLPLRPEWAGRDIEVFLLLTGEADVVPTVHLTADDPPLVRRRLTLHE